MEMAGGYRLVRIIGEGERAEVWLGHAGTDGVAAVKLLREGIEPSAFDDEIVALERARSRHVVALSDLGTDADGRPCLILERLPGPSIAQLLGQRAELHPGELVTATAPIVATVAELQRRGVVHGALSTRSVLLDEQGAPVLAGFGRARLIATGPLSAATIASDPDLIADRERLFGFVAAVAANTAGRAPDLMAWIEANRHADGVLDALVDRLHAVAPARAIAAHDPAHHVAMPVRHVPVASLAAPLEPDQGGLRQALAEIVEAGPAKTLVPRLRAALASVRRPVWVVGGIGAAAMLVAFVVIPAASSSSAAAIPGAPTAVAQSHSTAAPTAPLQSASPAASGDDPVEAARHVLVERMHCLTLDSARCLDDVDQPGSAALADDRAHVADPGRAPEVPKRLTLVERLGDTAIIGLGDPSPDGGYALSVLVVKTDAGWRLRDTITGVTP
ncbi:MAG: hypothetical protein JWN36_1982 [Microbacteriaceae bacterium]|nr:hypothetical protein [Microbacteriaceae bacterium]